MHVTKFVIRIARNTSARSHQWLRTVLALLLLAAICSAPMLTQAAPQPQVVPQVPVVLDGQVIQPAAFAKLPMTPRYFVDDARGRAAGVVYAFTTEEALAAYVGAHTPTAMLAANYRGCATFYEHDNGRGARIAKCSPERWPTMGWWNDRISSLSTGSGTYVRVWEHANFRGASLLITGNTAYDRLTAIGWNDVISSVRIGG